MPNPLEHTRDGGYGAAAEQMRIQQAAAAAAAEAGSAEALAAEAARREKALAEEAAVWRREGREQCVRENRPIEAQYLDPSPPLAGGVDEVNEISDPDAVVPTPRKSRLADAMAEVIEEHQEEAEYQAVEEVMGGASLVRWILVPDDESDGWTLGLSTESHEDEAPDQVYLDVTQAMMRKWRNSPDADKGLERFAAGIMEKVADALAEDLTDALIESLERITTGELREKQRLEAQEWTFPEGSDVSVPVEPTRTSVGEDEPHQALPEGDVEPFDSLDDYIAARDHYANTLSRDEYVAFLDTNQEYEDEIERQNA